MIELKELEVAKDYVKKLELLDKEGLEKNKRLNRVTPEDKKMTMVPLTFDYMFKSLFIRRQEFLKDFLMEVLKKDLGSKDKDIVISILNNETIKDNYNEFKKIADIFLRLNDDILLSIEVNRVKYEYRKTRNDRYIGKLIDSQVTKEDDYRDLFYKKIIQLNINALEKNKICSEREIVQYDKITRKIICENPKVYVKYIENYRELYYNGDRRRETIWFTFFSARTYVEAYNILLELYDEKKAQILMEEVIALNSNDALLHEWEKEKFTAYETYCATMDAEKEALARGIEKGMEEGLERGIEKGLEQGIEKGLEQGIEKGIERKSNEIIENMLSNNFTYEQVSLATNKSIEEIKKIAEELKNKETQN